MYRTRHVDSREVSFTNKNALADILRKYGEDSDEAKVRVKGQFPSQSFNGFFAADMIQASVDREEYGDPGAALIMAVDVARFGNDKSVIGFRQGRNARFPILEFGKISTVQLVQIVAGEINAKRPDAVVIEGTGIGAGVIDQLRALGYKIIEVHPGAAATRHDLYINRRAEYFSDFRDWVYDEGCLPNDPKLRAEMLGMMYSLDRHEQRVKIEAKEDMKKRGLSSPDRADMLALTFAVKIPRRDLNKVRVAGRKPRAKIDYDPFDV